MSELEAEIARLEASARVLDPDAARRRHHERLVLDYANGFLQKLPESPAYRAGFSGGLLDATPVREDPWPLEQLLAALAQDVDTPGINPASGGLLGYIPGGGQYYAALGDYLADVFNRYAGIAYASPGAVRLEKSLIRWMTGLVGYPETTAGDLTSGGSIANLMAIVAARQAAGLSGAELRSRPVYFSGQVHHCVDKAIRIAGLDECPRRRVPMDDRFRMDARALAAAIAADRGAGLDPWLVVASAGTTDTGAVDPLDEIAAVAEREKLWFHVDAAYGGFFLLCDRVKDALRGIERSDSVVMDPHKGLFLPYGTGAVLVRDGESLVAAHYQDASYMQDARAGAHELSPADLSPELSRPFRGLRLWLPLMLCGLSAYRAALDEKLLLARYFHGRLAGRRGWELGPPPDLSIVTYRYRPERGDPDAFNRALLQAIHDDGRIYVSSTRVNGNFVLRLAVLHFRTHREHIDLLLELLEHHARRLAD